MVFVTSGLQDERLSCRIIGKNLIRLTEDSLQAFHLKSEKKSTKITVMNRTQIKKK
jgi:hypothetical protein